MRDWRGGARRRLPHVGQMRTVSIKLTSQRAGRHWWLLHQKWLHQPSQVGVSFSVFSSFEFNQDGRSCERLYVDIFCLFAGRTHQVDGETTTTVHVRQQPLAQPRKLRRDRAGALTSPSSCLDGGVTRVGPGRYPQYTRADFGPEAVGSSNHRRYTSPTNTTHGRLKSRTFALLLRVAEPIQFRASSRA